MAWDRMTQAAHARLVREILLRYGSRPDVRLFGNPTAGAWTGRVVSRDSGVVVLERASFTQFGLANGSADVIGIGPAGRFLSFEAKTGRGKSRADQIAWRDMIRRFGGIAAEVRSPEDVERALAEGIV